jgi:uncharacterized Zn finger protein
MYRWKKYIPVSQRLERGMKKIKKLKKSPQPIKIEGRAIAKKFWGKKWCEHLESFSDYTNRLPRGRTYVRNGSVCHLEIKKGCVSAYVIGGSLYNVEVTITTLAENKWKLIKDKTRGQVSSLLELLTGKISNSVMEVVADHEKGLFPCEGEIKLSCDCPDWADMCKHIAAVLYGIGSRLDTQPDLLFLLRGVDASELISTSLKTVTTETDDLLEDEGLSDLFDIDFEEPETPLTGLQVKELRLKMNLSVVEFAEIMHVTPQTIYRWEKTKDVLKLRKESKDALSKLA